MAQYAYEMHVFTHSMAIKPNETKTGTLELSTRPIIGEEVRVGGIWVPIRSIRHTENDMTLILEITHESGDRGS